MPGSMNSYRSPAREKLIPCFYNYLGATLVAAASMMFAGSAQAAIDIDLMVAEEVDDNGNITVVDGSTLKVVYEVVEDTDNDLDKKDKIELRRVDDDSLVDSALRGKKKTGTVSLKVKKAAGDALYVQYVRKGKAGTVMTLIHHPSDPGGYEPLLVIARQKIDDLTLAVNAINVGTVSISNAAFKNENTTTAQEAQCQMAHNNNYFYYRAKAGATNASCDARASIQLPHGRTLTGLSCTVYDNSGSVINSIVFYLSRISLSDGTTNTIFTTPGTLDSASVQQVSDVSVSVPAYAKVDNSAFSYGILASFSTQDFTTLDFTGAVYGCSVTYE